MYNTSIFNICRGKTPDLLYILLKCFESSDGFHSCNECCHVPPSSWSHHHREERERSPRESPMTSPQAGGRALAYPRGVHENTDTLAVFSVSIWHPSVVF